jgi:hypothetical protein
LLSVICQWRARTSVRATDVVAERGDEGIATVRDVIAGGSRIVLEAVGHLPA